MRRPLAAGSVFAFVLLALVYGQEPAFRSSVTYIEVDAFVTDERGAFVKDLTRDDFEILEDGRPQTVSTFSFTQSGSLARPTFAIASIKEDRNGASVRTAYTETPEGVALQNVTAMRLILWTFGGVERDVVGGPDWIRSRRFDVAARTEAPVQRATELRLMMRTLLEDRFGLEAGYEQVERPVYALVLARGRIGPEMRRAESTCERRPEFVPQENLRRMFCGIDMASDGTGLQLVLGSHATMTQLAHGLSRSPFFDRPIVDRTGLAGEFDFAVNTSPRIVPDTSLAAPRAPGFEFMTALEVQLGLKLQPSRASVDVLVIRAVHPPTEN